MAVDYLSSLLKKFQCRPRTDTTGCTCDDDDLILESLAIHGVVSGDKLDSRCLSKVVRGVVHSLGLSESLSCDVSELGMALSVRSIQATYFSLNATWGFMHRITQLSKLCCNKVQRHERHERHESNFKE